MQAHLRRFSPYPFGSVGKGLERETLCPFPRLRRFGTHNIRCAQIRKHEFWNAESYAYCVSSPWQPKSKDACGKLPCIRRLSAISFSSCFLIGTHLKGSVFFYKSFPIFFKKCLTNSFPYCMIVHVPNEYVSVAQLDRASDYGSEGREFESSIARYRDCKEISLQSL